MLFYSIFFSVDILQKVIKVNNKWERIYTGITHFYYRYRELHYISGILAIADQSKKVIQIQINALVKIEESFLNLNANITIYIPQVTDINIIFNIHFSSF